MFENTAHCSNLPIQIPVGWGIAVPPRGRETRSISPENPTGAIGGGGRATEGTGARAARDLGKGWKVSPSMDIAPGQTLTLANIDGTGVITHIWATTHADHWRTLILRAYWDEADTPAIEVPYGDFFFQGWSRFAQVSSAMISSNPHGGFNSYWPMPFKNHATLTVENTSEVTVRIYFQITYELTSFLPELSYFHAQWRRSNPLPDRQMHTMLAEIEGEGSYVGTYIAWGSNSPGWWGEGEIKFYLDDDLDVPEEDRYPTICGTGTEDYFGGAWDFEIPGQGYVPYTTPYLGLPQVICPDGLYDSQQRFGMYRLHITDPIHFHRGIGVAIQALGWRSGWRYLPLHDDIASTVFFYLDRPSTQLPPTPDVDSMEVHLGNKAVPDLGATPMRPEPTI